MEAARGAVNGEKGLLLLWGLRVLEAPKVVV